MRLFIFLLGMLLNLAALGQSDKRLDTIAILLVHADYEDFFHSEVTSIQEDIIPKYDVKRLKHEGIYDCIFFRVVIKNDSCDGCEFILCYFSLEKQFYRLKGFKYNEFNDFYNYVLLGGTITTLEKRSKRLSLRQIKSNVSVEGFDLITCYKT